MKWACAECLDFFAVDELTRRTITRGKSAYVCQLCAERIDRLAGKIVGVTDQVEYEGDDAREREAARLRELYGSELD